MFLQILKWIDNDSVKPEEWGWVNIGNKLLPKTTSNKPAPDSLLKAIGYNCVGGYSCSNVCGKCQLKECTNVEIPEDERCRFQHFIVMYVLMLVMYVSQVCLLF